MSDRAIVDESDPGSKTQLSALFTALASGKKVVVGVSGCAVLGTGASITAPKIVKVQIYK